MTAKLENEYGVITIDDEVIARIAGYAALDCYGIVGMAAKNVKDGLVQLLKLESLTKGIKMTINENKINLEFHIIVEYGTRIPDVAFEIQNRVKKAVETMTGLTVLEVHVHVQGVSTEKTTGEEKEVQE